MDRNKKGFTLVELIAVIVILIILMVIAINMVNKNMERSRTSVFLKEANTFARGAMSKESVDRSENVAADDLFHNAIYGKVCYSIGDDTLGKYVSKPKNTYKGSVEVCYGLDCTYTTKLWITDGKHYIDGISDPSDENQITNSFTSDYPYTCGVAAIGGGTKGDLNIAEFDYTGSEQVMDVYLDGVYALEVWGAQGGDYSLVNVGGYGAYAYTEVELNKGDKLYVNVGAKGAGRCSVDDDTCKASYNGGSKGGAYIPAGGGATHIALTSGQIFAIDSNSILIAGGAGGGGYSDSTYNNNTTGGGYCSNRGMCGNTGIPGGVDQSVNNRRGYGGGYRMSNPFNRNYGDNTDMIYGGTSYVFYPGSQNGLMYCYNCTLGGYDFSVGKTIAGSSVSDTPKAQHAKIGNGYAKITYIGEFTQNS